jgi:hypothetical protein
MYCHTYINERCQAPASRTFWLGGPLHLPLLSFDLRSGKHDKTNSQDMHHVWWVEQLRKYEDAIHRQQIHTVCLPGLKSPEHNISFN